MADVERGVALQPDIIFQLGSLTKQFTAVAAMMLVEQRKLSTQEEISKYLPDRGSALGLGADRTCAISS